MVAIVRMMPLFWAHFHVNVLSRFTVIFVNTAIDPVIQIRVGMEEYVTDPRRPISTAHVLSRGLAVFVTSK